MGRSTVQGEQTDKCGLPDWPDNVHATVLGATVAVLWMDTTTPSVFLHRRLREWRLMRCFQLKDDKVDSINRNQPEDTHANLAGSEAARRIQDMSEDAQSCFFCTSASTGETQGIRPMSVEKADDAGNLWFLSASDSHKNREIEADPKVRLFFQGGKHAGFLTLEGHATISRDPARIDELWSPIMKTWFTEGKSDPRITVIQVTPTGGYYWDNKHGGLVAATKMVIGAAIGKTLDDSIEGQLRP